MTRTAFLPIFPCLRITDLFRRPDLRNLQPLRDARSWVQAYSGSTALGLAARSLKKTGRTHLLVPSFNCGHEIEPFLRANFKIDMYRIDRSGTIDLEHLSAQLTGSRQVVLVTHFFGFPQPIGEIVELCKKKNIYVLEDCAHSFLSRMEGLPLGSWGDLAIFSYRKTLPSPDGGALMINNPEIPLTLPTIQPDPMSVLKKTSQLLIYHLLDSASASSRLAYEALCRVKRLMLMAQSFIQERIPTDSLHLYSPDDESYQYSSQILDWRISSLSLKVISNCDRQQVRNARIENYRYVADALKNSERLRPLFPSLPDGACPLGFPLVGPENGEEIRNVMAGFPYLVLWWPHFHPAVDWREFSDSAWLKRNCYLLAIHQDLRKSQLDFLIDCALEADRRLGGKAA